MKIIEEQYLGDGVYASGDEYGITLDLRGQDCTARIGLEPEVLEALDRFKTRWQAALRAARHREERKHHKETSHE